MPQFGAGQRASGQPRADRGQLRFLPHHPAMDDHDVRSFTDQPTLFDLSQRHPGGGQAIEPYPDSAGVQFVPHLDLMEFGPLRPRRDHRQLRQLP